jgi:hypothetical protein
MTWVYLLLWILFSILEGIREAHYFDAFPRPAKRYDIHQIFAAQRVIVIFALSSHVIIALGFALMFPFIHDGVYYMWRHKLNVVTYPKGFWSNPSHTSTAMFDPNLWLRIIMFVVGIAGIVAYEIIK